MRTHLGTEETDLRFMWWAVLLGCLGSSSWEAVAAIVAGLVSWHLARQPYPAASRRMFSACAALSFTLPVVSWLLDRGGIRAGQIGDPGFPLIFSIAFAGLALFSYAMLRLAREGEREATHWRRAMGFAIGGALCGLIEAWIDPRLDRYDLGGAPLAIVGLTSLAAFLSAFPLGSRRVLRTA